MEVICVVLTMGVIGSFGVQTDEERSRATEIWEPVPKSVTTGEGSPPSDAIVLFDGTNLEAWKGDGDKQAAWKLEEGAMTVVPGTGSLWTKEAFGDVQLHLEWRTPSHVEGEGQGRGNSGVFLMGRYEVQVLDSYNNDTYVNGQAGSIYKQHIPLVNASRGPGQWQSYDIVFMAPRFRSDGSVSKAATMTVFHNGVLIQNYVELRGTTVYIGEPEYETHGPRGPLMLQDHRNPVSYRNIWVREIGN